MAKVTAGRRRDTRPLHLKMRVRILRRMSQAQMLALVERAIASGVVPPGIEIRWIDWQKGEGRYANEGRLPDPVLDELRAWYGIMQKGAVRVAPVKPAGPQRRKRGARGR